MDPPELASEPPRSRIELRAEVKSIGLGNVRGLANYLIIIVCIHILGEGHHTQTIIVGLLYK
jgi:hypothetical protein